MIHHRAPMRRASRRRRGGRRGRKAVLAGEEITSRWLSRPRRPGRVFAQIYPPCAGSAEAHDHLWRVGEGLRRPRKGARCRRGDRPKSDALDHSLHQVLAASGKISRCSRPAARKRRPACSNWRRFAWPPGSGATGFRFLSRTVGRGPDSLPHSDLPRSINLGGKPRRREGAGRAQTGLGFGRPTCPDRDRDVP